MNTATDQSSRLSEHFSSYERVAFPKLFPSDPKNAFFNAERGHREILRAWAGEESEFFPGIESFSFQDNELLECVLPGKVKASNPVGNAAGLDKYCQARDDVLARMGFGFHTIGSISQSFRAGNPTEVFVDENLQATPEGKGRWVIRQKLLQDEKASVNSRGLDNFGAEKTAQLISGHEHSMPCQASVVGESHEQYIAALETLYNGSGGKLEGFVVNVSCPNTSKGCQFQSDIPSLTALLSDAREVVKHKPLYVKMGPETSVDSLSLTEQKKEHIAALGRLFVDTGIDAVVAINSASKSVPEFARRQGGWGGKPIKKLMLEVSSILTKATGGELPVVACGGISTGADVLEAVEHGASAAKIGTAVFYHGPFAAAKINNERAALLEERHSSFKEFVDENCGEKAR